MKIMRVVLATIVLALLISGSAFAQSLLDAKAEKARVAEAIHQQQVIREKRLAYLAAHPPAPKKIGMALTTQCENVGEGEDRHLTCIQIEVPIECLTTVSQPCKEAYSKAVQAQNVRGTK
jgi:hypothetical protein